MSPDPKPDAELARARFGQATVTFEHRDTGALRTIVGIDPPVMVAYERTYQPTLMTLPLGEPVKRPRMTERRGLVTKAIENAIRAIEEDGNEGKWRVVCISTVASIETDVKEAGRIRDMPDGGAKGRTRLGVQMPEPDFLKRIGRLDLWDHVPSWSAGFGRGGTHEGEAQRRRRR